MKSKINKEFARKPIEFFKNSSFDFLENERSGTVVERGFVEENKIAETAIDKAHSKEGTKQNEFFKDCSNKFLENERYHTVVERGIIEEDVLGTQFNGIQNEQNQQKTATTSETQQTFVFSAGSLKRYVTTCYFQPKQIPVSYSETMILNIGSSKKKFFESVYYKNKLLPYKWSESMHTTVKGEEATNLQKSQIIIPIEKPTWHYISLEQQQNIAENVSVV